MKRTRFFTPRPFFYRLLSDKRLSEGGTQTFIDLYNTTIHKNYKKITLKNGKIYNL